MLILGLIIVSFKSSFLSIKWVSGVKYGTPKLFSVQRWIINIDRPTEIPNNPNIEANSIKKNLIILSEVLKL